MNRYIAVDWGTTNRRAYGLDASGREFGRIRDDRGVRSIARDEFPASVGALRAELGDLPLLLAGMVGSNRGWTEAPYLPCPVTLDDLVARLVEIPHERAWIVPGVAQNADGRYDVMRGEEVQILGAVTGGHSPADGIACHPGTHAKWTRIEGGAITRFRTVMTGEIFALLKQHSILAPQLAAPVDVGEAFLAGVNASLERCELTSELFSIRARGLLARLSTDDASSYTSGLLIGADVRIGLSEAAGEDPVTLIGEPQLTRLYAAAIGRAGHRCTRVDGEAAFLSGIAAIRERLT